MKKFIKRWLFLIIGMAAMYGLWMQQEPINEKREDEYA